MKQPTLRTLPRPRDVSRRVWVGALSFEERCLGSLQSLSADRKYVDSAFIVDYETQIQPKKRGIAKRQANRRGLQSLLKASGCDAIIESIHPYHLSAMRQVLRKVEQSLPSERQFLDVVVDITCLTKAHTLVLASWLAERGLNGPPVTICYTVPQQYGSPARHGGMMGRWLEVILAPCEFEPLQFSESADGIILLGHEGSRLDLALAIAEPIRALVLLARTQSNEELQIVSRTANATVVGGVIRGDYRGWKVEEVSTTDLADVQSLTVSATKAALEDGRRLIVFPFGPKVLVFATFLTALSLTPTSIWYCYPVPKSYDADYTVGIGSTRWIAVDWKA